MTVVLLGEAACTGEGEFMGDIDDTGTLSTLVNSVPGSIQLTGHKTEKP